VCISLTTSSFTAIHFGIVTLRSTQSQIPRSRSVPSPHVLPKHDPSPYVPPRPDHYPHVPSELPASQLPP
jgi:hypothetical protein